MGNSKSKAKKKKAEDSKGKWIIALTEPITARYILLEKLGEPGQFGYARKVQHKATGTLRAVKVIRKVRFGPEQFKHFRLEIDVMDKLSHPNIVKGHEVFETQSELQIVMELCSGGELFERIKQKQRYAEKDAAAVLKQLFEAVGYMHEKKIAHCDLKPDNFLFATPDENSAIKLIDFGMSKWVERRKYLEVLCGTSYYIAPEVFNKRYTTSCDMWSMGVVMFIMLFGFPPFHGSDDSEIARKIVRGFTPEVKKGYGAWFPSAIKCSEQARDLLSKLLVLDPVKRLSAKEVLQHPWINGQAATAPVLDAVMANLASFTKKSAFKAAVLGHFAKNMSSEDIKGLQDTFKKVDTNGDGILTIEEVQEAMKLGDSKMADLEQLFKAADVDGDGTLNWQELLHAALEMKLVAKEERLWSAFAEMDKDRNGMLSAEEIHSAVGKDMTLEKVREMIADVDKDGDGEISYDEFIDSWLKKQPQ